MFFAWGSGLPVGVLGFRVLRCVVSFLFREGGGGWPCRSGKSLPSTFSSWGQKFYVLLVSESIGVPMLEVR